MAASQEHLDKMEPVSCDIPHHLYEDMCGGPCASDLLSRPALYKEIIDTARHMGVYWLPGCGSCGVESKYPELCLCTEVAREVARKVATEVPYEEIQSWFSRPLSNEASTPYHTYEIGSSSQTPTNVRRMKPDTLDLPFIQSNSSGKDIVISQSNSSGKDIVISQSNSSGKDTVIELGNPNKAVGGQEHHLPPNNSSEWENLCRFSPQLELKRTNQQGATSNPPQPPTSNLEGISQEITIQMLFCEIKQIIVALYTRSPPPKPINLSRLGRCYDFSELPTLPVNLPTLPVNLKDGFDGLVGLMTMRAFFGNTRFSRLVEFCYFAFLILGFVQIVPGAGSRTRMWIGVLRMLSYIGTIFAIMLVIVTHRA